MQRVILPKLNCFVLGLLLTSDSSHALREFGIHTNETHSDIWQLAQGAQRKSLVLASSVGNGWRNCCTEPQVIFLANFFCYGLICSILWKSGVLLPLRLLAAVLHEVGHALAAWLTFSPVWRFEVDLDVGGITQWSSLCPSLTKHFVLPAGFLCSSLWGAVLVVCCTKPLFAGRATISLLLCLAVLPLQAVFFRFKWRHNRSEDVTAVNFSLAMMAFLGSLHVFCCFTSWPYRHLIMHKVLLLLGTLNTLHVLFDMSEDCTLRPLERSDSQQYARLLESHVCCCMTVQARFIGVLWVMLHCCIAGIALDVALQLITDETEPSGALVISREWLYVCGVAVVAALAYRACCSRLCGGR